MGSVTVLNHMTTDPMVDPIDGSLAPSAKRLERAANTSPYDTC